MRPMKALQSIGPGLLGLLTVALIILVRIADPAPLERLQLQVFDFYQTLSPRQTDAENRVVVVDIDEDSIEQLGQWPWPRTRLAELTSRLNNAGASVIAYDIVFSEKDRTSPEAIADQFTALGTPSDVSSAFLVELASLPSNDQIFAQSMAKAPVVTGYFLSFDEIGRAVEPKASFTLSGTFPGKSVQSYSGSLQPLPILEKAAQGSGFVSLDSDADGIVRRVPLVAIHRDTLIPSLSLEAMRLALGEGSPNLLTSDGSGETLSSPGDAVALRLSDLEIPVNEAGEMWVHFPEAGKQPTIPAAPIITGKMSLEDLASDVSGKIVLVGGSAAGLQDLVSTPASERTAGVNVHAAALEQMLGGHFLQRPDWAIGFELFCVIFLGMVFALIVPRLGALWGAFFALIALAAIIWSSWLSFAAGRYLFDPTYPGLTIVAVYTLQTVATYYREERQRSYIHSAFDRYLSPELVRQIADDPDKLELGGIERDMSVLMCDIRGFSSISERYSPTEVIEFLIEFLTPMSDILLQHRATIDKYIGDAILAFWNAPLDDPDHETNAARAALEMTAKLEELNSTLADKEGVTWPRKVRIGIGLNSGRCCVGNMGSRQRLSYSLIGDTVNVAARLEGLTKAYGVPIMVGEDMAKALDGFALFEVDQVQVVGRSQPERIFALIGDESRTGESEYLNLVQAHTAMLEAYRACQWDNAEEILTAYRSTYAHEGLPRLALLFENRIERLRVDPPRPGWDGVYQATEK